MTIVMISTAVALAAAAIFDLRAAEASAGTCQSCGWALKPNAKFCSHCGTKVPPPQPAPAPTPEAGQNVFCINCGKPYDRSFSFCPDCGTKNPMTSQ